MIAIPDFGPGAMENWGLITYKERYLLYENGVSSEKSKQLTAKVIAHELGYQVCLLWVCLRENICKQLTAKIIAHE